MAHIQLHFCWITCLASGQESLSQASLRQQTEVHYALPEEDCSVKDLRGLPSVENDADVEQQTTTDEEEPRQHRKCD